MSLVGSTYRFYIVIMLNRLQLGLNFLLLIKFYNWSFQNNFRLLLNNIKNIDLLEIHLHIFLITFNLCQNSL